MRSKFFFLLLAWITPAIGFCQQVGTEIPLWANGAPGFEERRNEPTQAKDWWMKNIHNPSITVYPEKITRACRDGLIKLNTYA